MRLKKRQKTRGRWQRASLLVVGGLLGLFVLANAGMWVAYRGRALPHSSFGQMPVSGASFAALAKLSSSATLPSQLTIYKGTTSKAIAPGDLGIGVDVAASVHALEHSKLRWLPLLSFVKHSDAPLKVRVDTTASQATINALAADFALPAASQHIAFNGSSFVEVGPQNGYELNKATVVNAAVQAMQKGKTTFVAPTTPLAASTARVDLTQQIQALQKALGVKLGFVYQGQTVTPSANDIGNWYASDGRGMSIASDKLVSYLRGVAQHLGITIANPNDLAAAATYAISKGQSLNLAVVPARSSTVVRTYCTAVRDVSSSVLGDLEGKLAATYADTRGWNDGGRIAFEHVSSGCQYTVWMSASADMTKFGAICDNYYNCQVGTNVIMNYDRWTGATPPWNQTGGSLEDYHTLMIDHETGHRLGFLDNPTCPGAGQPAPVMMQQSIALKGCTFNIWPLVSEFAALNKMLGL